MANAKGKGSKGKSTRSRKATALHVYRMPAKAAHLGILCCHELKPEQPCLKPVVYYDPEISVKCSINSPFHISKCKWDSC